MLGRASIIAFAVTENPDAARAFYRDTLGLTLTEDTPFALAFDANGTMLRIQIVPAVAPLPYTSLGWHVDDIHATIAQLTQRGVTFEHYDGVDQDTDGVWTSPSGAKVAWFKDPDRNTLSLTES